MKNPTRIRNASGRSLALALDDVLSALQRAGIPSVIIGGYSVQEHGYYRTTDDIDVVVPDVAAARAALVSGEKFKPNEGSSMTVTHPDTKFKVNLLKGGALVDRNVKVPLPQPTTVGRNVVPLATLIALKLDAYRTHPVDRVKDLADVVELIKANNLPRDFIPEPDYGKLWDDLHRDLKTQLLR